MRIIAFIEDDEVMKRFSSICTFGSKKPNRRPCSELTQTQAILRKTESSPHRFGNCFGMAILTELPILKEQDYFGNGNIRRT